MNYTIVAAIIIQSVISKANLLLGALAGYVITTGILIWGLGVYRNPYHFIAVFGIELSKGVFIGACVAWYIFDTFELLGAISAEEADDKSDLGKTESENKVGIKKEIHTSKEDQFPADSYAMKDERAGKPKMILMPEKVVHFRISCPKCEAAGRIDQARVPPEGIWIRCPKCYARFFVRRKNGI